MRVSCIDVRPFMATRHNCILAICCAFEMDLYTQSVCSKGCSSYFLNNLTSVHWVSIGLTDMHGGFMHCCPSMHGYPPWVTTHWKSDPPFTCIWMGKAMPLALFIMCIAWVAACSLGFERGGHMGVPCTFVRPCMAVHHKKLHIGILYHLSNKSVCIDGVPLGLFTTFVGSVDICCRVSIVRTAVHGGSMHRCLAKHGCPPWETTYWKSVPHLNLFA